jgi:hypothetical protein
MQNPDASYRRHQSMRRMRVLAVCFSTVALCLALVTADLAVTLGAVAIWLLTLFALALGVWRAHKSSNL